jgi:hypothetical protein
MITDNLEPGVPSFGRCAANFFKEREQDLSQLNRLDFTTSALVGTQPQVMILIAEVQVLTGDQRSITDG